MHFVRAEVVKNIKNVVVGKSCSKTVASVSCFSNLSLAALSGTLTGLVFSFPKLSIIAWCSLVPFIYVLSRTKDKTGVWPAIVFAFFYYGTAIFWITNVTNLGFIFLLFYLSGFSVLFFLLGRYFLNKHYLSISLPALWVMLEFLKETIWCGFGWANLGYSQYQNLNLVQIADIGGVKIITFLIVSCNVLVWEVVFCWRKYSGKKKIIKTGLFILVVLGCFIYSAYCLRKFDKPQGSNGKIEKKILKFSLIQPNIPQELKWNPRLSAKIVSHLAKLTKVSGLEDLVIFPEAVWPYIIKENEDGFLKKFVKNEKRNVLIGVPVEENGRFYNAAMLIDIYGEIVGSYRKIKIVPFGEYIPLRKFLSFISVINSVGDMSRGSLIKRFEYGGKKFSVLICFEDIFPNHVSEFSKGNDFLINITNDAWFNGEPQASQHFAIMTFRAIENRIPIIRSSNTGISGWVSMSGEAQRMNHNGREVFFSDSRNFEIVLNKQKSFYTKYGEAGLFICCFLILGVVSLTKNKYQPITKQGETNGD